MRKHKVKNITASIVVVLYIMAAIILPALHESGLIFPHHHHNLDADTISDHHNNKPYAFSEETSNCDHHKPHSGDCPICHFKNYFGGIKYFEPVYHLISLVFPVYQEIRSIDYISTKRISDAIPRAPPCA